MNKESKIKEGDETEMEDGHHVLYDTDGSKFKFSTGGIGSVVKYLAKGFLLHPPSKESAAAVRKAKTVADLKKEKARVKAKAVAAARDAKALTEAKAEVAAEEKILADAEKAEAKARADAEKANR